MKFVPITYRAVILIALAFAVASCSSSQRFSSAGRMCPASSETNVAKTGLKSKSSPKETDNSNYKSEKLDNVQSKIVSNAETWIGVPYAWGGNTRNGVDCSGFVKNIYNDVGVDLPRTAHQQYNYAKKIADKDRKTGDLVFFSKGSKISHVGIYIGGGKIIHSSSGKGVIQQSLTDTYLQSIYVGAGRVLDK